MINYKIILFIKVAKVKIKQMKIDLTKKELKLIKKALLNRRLGKDEEKTRDSIYDKIENAEISQIIAKDGLPYLKPII